MRTPIVVLAIVGVLAAAELKLDDGLTVHEWGTFTSVAGESGESVSWNVLGCGSDLPGFVIRQGLRFKIAQPGTVRMETPVMYFYGWREMTANVKVQFPQGTMTEWYPGVEGAPEKVGSVLAWNDIKVQPGAVQEFPTEKTGNRYYAARATDAAPLAIGDQHEKFLFYRGVGRFQVPLNIRVSGYGQVTAENRASSGVPLAILFDNHDGRVRFSAAGSIDGTVAIEEPAVHADSLTELRKTLQDGLIAQGLFPKEAHAMLETWNDSWFEEGSRLIYIVPGAVVDEMLPLHVDPAPSEIARVFVGRIELVTPETKRAVESAVARADWAAVNRYGRFLEPILRRVYPGNGRKVAEVESAVMKFRKGSGVGCE
jgi:hypothetical protein